MSTPEESTRRPENDYSKIEESFADAFELQVSPWSASINFGVRAMKPEEDNVYSIRVCHLLCRLFGYLGQLWATGQRDALFVADPVSCYGISTQTRLNRISPQNTRMMYPAGFV